MPKIKNIIIFVTIGVVFILIYIFFIKPSSSDTDALISSTPSPVVGDTSASGEDAAMTDEFLSLLLNVKNIKLNDTIFSDSAFNSLHDSSIILTPDGTEGRPNPFAPVGTDNTAPAATPTTLVPPATTPLSATPATPKTTVTPPATTTPPAAQ